MKSILLCTAEHCSQGLDFDKIMVAFFQILEFLIILPSTISPCFPNHLDKTSSTEVFDLFPNCTKNIFLFEKSHFQLSSDNYVKLLNFSCPPTLIMKPSVRDVLWFCKNESTNFRLTIVARHRLKNIEMFSIEGSYCAV
jgi:hypothetical protein